MANGAFVHRGAIAADPRVLPIGTRVYVSAGSLSGEYVVKDTGGAIKGRRIDIWVPSTAQAMNFGRRTVQLTVLSGRRNSGATAATAKNAQSAGGSNQAKRK
jgi:3D (Asp-Asp-Asp) domain-containing protein